MRIFLRNFKFFIFLFFLSLNFNNYSLAHIRGTFLSEEEAEKRALELGCEEYIRTRINGCHAKTKKNYIFI